MYLPNQLIDISLTNVVLLLTGKHQQIKKSQSSPSLFLVLCSILIAIAIDKNSRMRKIEF
jgi:hypothetical protein